MESASFKIQIWSKTDCHSALLNGKNHELKKHIKSKNNNSFLVQ